MKNKMDMHTNGSAQELAAVKARFEAHMDRHAGLPWRTVEERLNANPEKLRALLDMERTGGEPDVVLLDGEKGDPVFIDCSPESPAGRRSLCYDGEALDSRKENKPAGSALEMAEEMGIELLSEERYRALQSFGEFDTRTSSWVKTPPEVRERGGALFCDRRYGRVFVYHNGASSYYGARGFRGLLRF